MKLTLLLIITFVSANVFAQKNYIKGIQKVTFRVGPERTKKIIRMLESESIVTLVEAGDQWSKVKDDTGEEGYVLNRFLSKETPYSLRYKWLKSKYDKLQEKNEELNTSLNELKGTLNQTQSALKTTEESLTETNSSFEELKSGSAEYLSLKKKYEETKNKLATQNSKVGELEAKVSTYYIFWFLAGSGVLFLGWLIGLVSRKRKRAGSLSF